MKRIFSALQILSIFILLSIIVGVDSCSQQTPVDNFGGLKASFTENAPPLNVITNQVFPIYVDIENAGDANVNKDTAKFYLLGIGQNIQNVKASLSNSNLLDKGASERLEFASSAKSTLELTNPFTLSMFLTSCYKYGGRAQGDVCIASSNKSNICSISGTKSVSNSAEPVQISGLTEEIVGSKLQISFNVVNSGKGEVYLPDADCDKLFASQTKDINEVLKNGKLKIRVNALGEDFKCRLQMLTPPYSNLDGEEGAADLGKVTCEKTVAGIEDHPAVLRIVLDYIYVETNSQSIVITPS